MKKLLEICRNGDVATRLSMIIMGAGYCARGQYVKGIIMTVIEVLFFLAVYLQVEHSGYRTERRVS